MAPDVHNGFSFWWYPCFATAEELHRITYNQCWAEAELGFEWSHEFYEMLQNTVGGGKEKMRWYFARYGWPDGHPSATSEEQEAFIAHLHARKTEMYKALIAEGKAGARPGVLRLIDEAHDHGVRLAICSAANASSVSFVLDRLIGAERLKKFEFVLAGDVVSKKKPDPMIYNVARERLGVAVEDCVVIEDSQIGLEAGLAAGMKVIITHTPYTASQSFEGAASVYPNLGEPGKDTEFVSVDTLFPGVFSVSTV